MEFMVRHGWVTLKNVAEYFSFSYSTVYRWAVERKNFPKGFPKAERIGRFWFLRWAGVQKFEAGLMTYAQMKEAGIDVGTPGKMDYGDIFVESE